MKFTTSLFVLAATLASRLAEAKPVDTGLDARDFALNTGPGVFLVTATVTVNGEPSSFLTYAPVSPDATPTLYVTPIIVENAAVTISKAGGFEPQITAPPSTTFMTVAK